MVTSAETTRPSTLVFLALRRYVRKWLCFKNQSLASKQKGIGIYVFAYVHFQYINEEFGFHVMSLSFRGIEKTAGL